MTSFYGDAGALDRPASGFGRCAWLPVQAATARMRGGCENGGPSVITEEICLSPNENAATACN
jgi:hypothetical protein